MICFLSLPSQSVGRHLYWSLAKSGRWKFSLTSLLTYLNETLDLVTTWELKSVFGLLGCVRCKLVLSLNGSYETLLKVVFIFPLSNLHSQFTFKTQPRSAISRCLPIPHIQLEVFGYTNDTPSEEDRKVHTFILKIKWRQTKINCMASVQ